MSVQTHQSFIEALQRDIDEYFAEIGQERATAKEIAVWLIRTRRWMPPEDVLIRVCRDDVARAMREEVITDTRGHPVRTKHVARERRDDQQTYLWADIRNLDTPRSHWEASFQQRREQIVGDCRQLSYDIDYYNESRPQEEPIQKEFDFTYDLELAEFPSEYPPKKAR